MAETVDDILSDYDLNSDGFIDYAEFVQRQRGQDDENEENKTKKP